MDSHHLHDRLHDAVHRGSRKATEDDVAGVAAVVLQIVTELTGELATVIAELSDRVEALEARAGLRPVPGWGQVGETLGTAWGRPVDGVQTFANAP